ncbi:hypothetical protein [Micromonospora radicis]|uniref:DUF3040 domain-containing protein n=1 Tax=Micromonospora radicis TaxID=1894971 RepID=A0A418N134_9ACTN|nr:hypothetical protein [Micromonospora radicis]RIV40898.1 hypothetical protein D2L64_04740 [Micromonospora radicis]
MAESDRDLPFRKTTQQPVSDQPGLTWLGLLREVLRDHEMLVSAMALLAMITCLVGVFWMVVAASTLGFAISVPGAIALLGLTLARSHRKKRRGYRR